MLFETILIGIACVALMYFIQLPFKYWKNRNIPHPPVSYLFGNVGEIISLKKSLCQLYDDIYNKYPELPYVGFYKARTPCLLIRSPELIQEIIVKNFNNFRDNDVNVNKDDPLYAKNPFCAKGKEWKEGRSKVAPSFTPKRIKEMVPLIMAVSKNLIEYIKSNVVGSSEGTNIKELSLKYTTDAVANCALGLEANSFEDPHSEYIKMIGKILSPSFANAIKFVLIFIFPSLAKLLKLKVIPDDATEYYKNIVNKTIQYRNSNKIYRGDFLDGMNEIQQKLGQDAFTNEDITVHVVSFFTDGTETSALALAFALYELGLHPDIQTQLIDEIRETLIKHDGILSYEAIQDMELLERISNENLRKNPPVGFLKKVCTARTTLESPFSNSDKLVIDVGTPIVIPSYSIHHDSKYYSDPSTFDPERFSDDNVRTRPKYTFLSFGEGPRICLGQRFAMTSIKIALVNIIKNFEVKVHKSTTVPYEIDPHYFLLSPKGGIRLDFYNRKQVE